MKTHELVSIIETPLNVLHRHRIGIRDVQYLEMYSEYLRMKGEGLKTSYIVCILCERHRIGRTKFFNIIRRFKADL
jgi:hypothetical protein